MLNYNLVLKAGELYTAGDIETDGSRERATGLYLRDTRHLNAFVVTIDGAVPEILSVTTHDASHAVVISSNRLIERHGEDVHPQKLLLVQDVTLADTLRVTIMLRNFDSRPISVQLGVELAADFRDLFDIRGFHRERRGKWQWPRIDSREVVFGYQGLDGLKAETAVTFDQEANVSLCTYPVEIREGSLTALPNTELGHLQHEWVDVPAVAIAFDVALQPREQWAVAIDITPKPAAGPAVVGRHGGQTAATVTTDNTLFNQVLEQCRADLDALQTPFSHGVLPAAGIPWFVAPFGRDSLITSLQTLYLSPDRAEGTVRTLAAMQGTRVDQSREEQPGKILHEVRYGEMSRTGEVPHSLYYGTVDATPLWIWLLAETVIWTGDATLLHDLMPNVRAALDWIDQYGDLDGDGLIEYRTDAQGVGHITHQVWKDSFDSLNHVDGSPAHGPVAAVEVQGYIFAACSRLAAAASTASLAGLATDLRSRATSIRRQIEERFWQEQEGIYAQALDGDKRAVAVVSSNAGHLLACGVPSPERAARLADRFTGKDINCGWGLRTLSSSAASYNPMSYHNGSVWPHDNSLIGAGLYRYGETSAAHDVATSLFDVAATMPLHRLPELFCGFAREGIALDAPVNYPVSCSPQAWAAGSLVYLVQGMLGLEVDSESRSLLVSPSLPDWLNELTIRNLCLLGHEGDLMVRRSGDDYAIEARGFPVQRAS